MSVAHSDNSSFSRHAHIFHAKVDSCSEAILETLESSESKDVLDSSLWGDARCVQDML